MGTIARMNVVLGMDSGDFERGVRNAEAAGESLSKKLGKVGQAMTAGVTLPILGAATAAVKFATDFNESMANVASLGIASDRVKELKGNIQDMAIATGKSTDDLADGLYQVISAFGDSADSASILEINAKAAAAGLATTTEAINLTSAVTKGYGDTSAAAVQHAADLAQQTVILGQTTFPELAGSVGKVVPLMAALGGTQEELFATMATATGVTGNAAEVSTQLRGVLQSLMAPTEDMSTLMSSMGYETGAALLQGEGLQGVLAAVTKAADASGQPLQKYIGSIEGQTLALALAGPQADVYSEKLKAMSNVAGVADAAFKAQTQGINKAGFTMKQLAAKAQVVAQKIGDGLAPALAAVFDIVTPLVDKVIELADWFSKADVNTQTWIVGAVALVAALGPLLAMMPAIATAISVMFSPIGLAIAAVGALAAAWATNFGGIQQKTQMVFKALEPVFAELQEWFNLLSKGDFSGLTGRIGDTLQGIQVAIDTFKWADFITPLTNWGVYIAKLAWDTVVTTLTNWGQWIASLDWGGFITKLSDWGEYIKGTLLNWGDYITKLDWGGYITTVLDWGTYITAKLSDWGAYITGIDWGAYITVLSDWGKYITATLTDWGTYVTQLDWGAYITAFSAWGTYVSKLDWGDYITKLWGDYVTKLSWADYVSKLNWDNYATKLDWALWIPALVWSVVITPVRWASWIPQVLWDNFISKLSWDGFIQAITNWDAWVSMLEWSTLVLPVFWPAYIEKLGIAQWLEAIGESPQWTSFIEKLDWFAHIPGLNWPTWITSLEWKSFIDNLVWPAISAPSWGSFIEKLKWPSIPAFPGWEAIVRGIFGTPGTGKVPDNVGAGGGVTPSRGGMVTPYGGIGLPADLFHASGGLAKGLAVVGEEGPELAFFGGIGADILSNPDSIKWLQSLGIPGFANGTGPMPPIGPQMSPSGYAIQARPEGLLPPIMAKLTEASEAMSSAGESLTESATVMGDSTEAFRSALQSVPGLFSTSNVTADQMRQAEMGIPQEFADNYLRRLTDEVVNGVDWEGVDIGDAAAAAGIDPNLPAEAILELFKAAWNDSSLFANPENLKFIDQSAVKAQIQKQQDQLAGQMNILALFGIKDDNIASQVQGLGTVLSNNFQDQMTPELFNPVGAKMVGAMAGGFADAGAASTAGGNMVGAIQTALTQADMKDKLMTSGESAAAIYWEGWTNFFAKVRPPVPEPPGTGNPATPPGKALGGPVSSGVPYIVGERGQELFVPNVNGQIIPNNELGAWWDMSGANGGAAVNIDTVVVNNEVDIRELAYQVAGYMQRRR